MQNAATVTMDTGESQLAVLSLEELKTSSKIANTSLRVTNMLEDCSYYIQGTQAPHKQAQIADVSLGVTRDW